MRRLVQIIAVTAALGCSGCVGDAARVFEAPACGAGETMIETQLFFGMSKPDGGKVTASQWSAFVQREVAPRFPEGFSVFDSGGYWLDGKTKKTIAEPSKIVMRLHAPDAAADATIDAIAAAYKKQFAQESVLRVDKPVCARF